MKAHGVLFQAITRLFRVPEQLLRQHSAVSAAFLNKEEAGRVEVLQSGYLPANSALNHLWFWLSQSHPANKKAEPRKRYKICVPCTQHTFRVEGEMGESHCCSQSCVIKGDNRMSLRVLVLGILLRLASFWAVALPRLLSLLVSLSTLYFHL